MSFPLRLARNHIFVGSPFTVKIKISPTLLSRQLLTPLVHLVNYRSHTQCSPHLKCEYDEFHLITPSRMIRRFRWLKGSSVGCGARPGNKVEQRPPLSCNRRSWVLLRRERAYILHGKNSNFLNDEPTIESVCIRLFGETSYRHFVCFQQSIQLLTVLFLDS